MQKRVKIIATLGPATEIHGGLKFGEDGFWDRPIDLESTSDNIADLIKAGVNIFRFNFSHGTHDEHAQKMECVRMAEQKTGQKVGFMLDTKGPEIRTELFENGEKQFDYQTGDQIRVITKQGVKSTRDKIALNVAGNIDIFDYVEPNQQILIEDGKLGLRITSKDDSARELIVTVENSGAIADQKNVNIPGTKIPFPALDERDEGDIRFGLGEGINYIAISFSRSANDINVVRAILAETGNDQVKLIPKIENREGLENLDQILAVSDGVMVARGDMGTEVPFEMVPVYQKHIIKKANIAGKPVITATNMLESMTSKPRATRAEISDVFNAVIDGTDATMLSGESANGLYPRESVATMAKVDRLAQDELPEFGRFSLEGFTTDTHAKQIALSVREAAQHGQVKAVVVYTETGESAQTVAQYRPDADILAVTFDEKIQKSLMPVYGVEPIVDRQPTDSDDMFARAEELAQQYGLANVGDDIIIVAGVPVGHGHTNTLRVHTISEKYEF
ncbi:MAG: pyruvate kinase [Candidatus Nanoperiomorbaceae bacterium]